MKRVLFVDIRNTGRSVMAEAWFNHLARGKAEASSCGTMPALKRDPIVTRVLAESGLQPPSRPPQGVTQSIVTRADMVIVLGNDVPARAFSPHATWDLSDPTGQPLEHYRALRESVRKRVEQLIEQLDGRALEPPDQERQLAVRAQGLMQDRQAENLLLLFQQSAYETWRPTLSGQWSGWGG